MRQASKSLYVPHKAQRRGTASTEEKKKDRGGKLKRGKGLQFGTEDAPKSYTYPRITVVAASVLLHADLEGEMLKLRMIYFLSHDLCSISHGEVFIYYRK